MAHAQIELYAPPETHLDPDQAVDAIGEAWGWRRVVFVVPPETLDDSGLIFPTRQDAMSDALAKHPSWPVG